MQIFTTIINLILSVAGLIAFLWTMIGTPIGVVWLIVHLSQKNHKLDKKKWVIVTFGGMIVLLLVFVIYAIVALFTPLLSVVSQF